MPATNCPSAASFSVSPRRFRTSSRSASRRVWGVSARARDSVDKLHVLDRARELTSELVGLIEQIALAARLDAYTFEDDRAERASAAAERHRDHRGRHGVLGRR